MSTATTDIPSNMMSLYIPIGGAALAIALYVTSFVTTSKLLGSSDKWKEIQAQMPTILGTALTGGFISFIACAIFFSQLDNNKYIIYILIALSCFALCFSYLSIAIAVISHA